MSSDSRWSGGAANRSWQSGTRIEPPTETDVIEKQVRGYLADCKRFRLTPSEDGAHQVVFGPKDAVQAAYRRLTARTEAATAAGEGNEHG